MSKKYTVQELMSAIGVLRKMDLDEYLLLVTPPATPADEGNRPYVPGKRTMLGNMYKDMNEDMLEWLGILNKGMIEKAIEYGLKNAD